MEINALVSERIPRWTWQFVALLVSFLLVGQVLLFWFGGATLGFQSASAALIALPWVGLVGLGVWFLARLTQQPLALFFILGMVPRVAGVLGTAWLWTQAWPSCQAKSFWLWLIVYYLIAIFVEILILGAELLPTPNITRAK